VALFARSRRCTTSAAFEGRTDTINTSERDGLVRRQAFATVPVTVEYSITPLGKTLAGVVGVTALALRAVHCLQWPARRSVDQCR
jgi:hypothetical protein